MNYFYSIHGYDVKLLWDRVRQWALQKVPLMNIYWFDGQANLIDRWLSGKSTTLAR